MLAYKKMRLLETRLYSEFVAVASILLLLGIATYQRNSVWKNDLSLWQDNVKKSLSKARPHNYLGIAYQNEGLIDKAVKHYQISIWSAPGYSGPYNNLGICYFEKGDIDKAIIEFQHAIQINPKNAEAHYNLGIAYGSKGLYKQALMEIRKGKEFSTRGKWQAILKKMKLKDQ